MHAKFRLNLRSQVILHGPMLSRPCPLSAFEVMDVGGRIVKRNRPVIPVRKG